MAVIDIGVSDIINRTGTWSFNYTTIILENPANDSGTITEINVWANQDLTGFKVGTFFGSGGTFECRDFALIGSVTAGSKQTFTEDSESTPLAIEVQTGDYLGFISTGGLIESTTGGDGVYYKSGDQTGEGEVSGYSAYATTISANGTGETSAVGTNMKINIGDVWKDVESMKINIGDVWKDVAEVKQNISNTWRTIF